MSDPDRAAPRAPEVTPYIEALTEPARARLAALGKGAGDAVRVRVTLDLAPRPVEVPEALAAALDAAPAAKAAWEALSPSMRREYAGWVASAKRDETRASRVRQTLERVTAAPARGPRAGGRVRG